MSDTPRTLATVYRVQRRSCIPEHNRPVVWYEVTAGHDTRDYAAVNYSPTTRIVGKFRTNDEAQAFVAEQSAT